jgi:hypothetical protein
MEELLDGIATFQDVYLHWSLPTFAGEPGRAHDTLFALRSNLFMQKLLCAVLRENEERSRNGD